VLLALDRAADARTICEEALRALAAPSATASPYNRVRLNEALRDACERLGDFRAALQAQKAAQQAALPVIGRSTRARYVSLKLQARTGEGRPDAARDQVRLQAVDRGLQDLAAGLAAPPVPAAAEDAMARQRRFIAHVSHEIRGALNGVLGMNELLLRTELDPRQSRYVSIAQSSAQTVLALLNDVLDLAKLEAGKFELNADVLDLSGLVRELASIFEPQAQLSGLRLQLEITEPVPALIGDRLRIRQILTNLLCNALKFTRKGHIAIRVGCAHTPSRRCRAVVEVIDTGLGIAPDALDHLFQEFAQTGTAADRAKGSGLGLALSRELARRMGGDLTATSTLGQGSNFRLELELEPAREEAHIVPA
jgi:signal transduction histidine kinase